MAFQVWIKRYHQAPQQLAAATTAKQAHRLLGSVIRGKRRMADLEEAYAVGRYGWRYSQQQIAQQCGWRG